MTLPLPCPFVDDMEILKMGFFFLLLFFIMEYIDVFFFYLNLNLLRNLLGSVDSEYSNMIPKIGKLLQVKKLLKQAPKTSTS